MFLKLWNRVVCGVLWHSVATRDRSFVVPGGTACRRCGKVFGRKGKGIYVDIVADHVFEAEAGVGDRCCASGRNLVAWGRKDLAPPQQRWRAWRHSRNRVDVSVGTLN